MERFSGTRHRSSLQTRITLWFGAFVALSMLLLGATVGYRLFNSLSATLEARLKEQAELGGGRLEQRFEYLLESALGLAKNPILINGISDPQGRETYLPQLVANFMEGRDVRAVALLDFDGRPVYASQWALPTYQESKQLRTALNLGVLGQEIDLERRAWRLYVPVLYYKTTQGALVVSYNLPSVVERILSGTPDVQQRLLSGNQVIYTAGQPLVGDLLWARRPLRRAGNGELAPLDLELEVGTPRDRLIAPAKTAMRDVALLGLALTAIAILLARWFGHHLARPILTLRERVARADGTPERRCAPLGTGDELEDLASEVDRRAEALRDIQLKLETRVQQRTAELRLALDAAEAANRAKSVFLANMSHELRTPLNAILGFSTIMRSDPQVPVTQIESLDIINRSGEHLLALINDVLEVAKIEAGRVQLEMAPFDLGGMIRDVTDMMRLRAEQKGLFLKLDQAPEFPRYIRGDETRLRQILVNLLGNAVKFTSTGGVIVRLGVGQRDRRQVLIEVEDTGPGIRQEDQERIFKPFEQVMEGGEQKGTGLGLTITRQFVELMGGTLAVESTPGQGSRFRVELSVELAEAPRAEPVEFRQVIGLAPGQPAYRILIAEDQRENQILLSRLMEAIGLETRVAENGVRCLEIFRDWPADLIWMDRRMPVMDGVEAAQRVRQLPGGESVKIVAVTASAFTEQQDEMLAAGMDEFVRKPYRPSEIYECLARQLGLKFIYGEEPKTAPAAIATPTAEQVTALPVALRQELAEALTELDSERIASLLDQVQQLDSQLGGFLSRLAEGFDYPAMLNVLQKASDEEYS